MKKVIFSLVFLSIGFFSYGQIPSGGPIISNWADYDASSDDGAYVPASAIANQLNGNPISNCHGYAFFQAMGQPLPTNTNASGIVGGDELGDYFYVYNPPSGAPNGYTILYPTTKELATHIIWHDPKLSAGPSGLDDAAHSAIFSQFNDLPRSDDYCQSANGLSPPLVVHTIQTYSNLNPKYVVKYYSYNNPIPLNHEPITPTSIFNCGAFVMNEVSYPSGNDGGLFALSEATVPNSSRSYVWSNGSQLIENTGLCSGTYTVTVTESPTNYVCTASVQLSNLNPALEHFSYVAHSSGVNCAGSVGLGSATVNLVSSLNPNNYSFLWDANANSQQTATATNLCNGLYNVTITSNVTGCSEVHTADVPVGFGSLRKKSISDQGSTIESKLNLLVNIRSKGIIIKGIDQTMNAIIYDTRGRVIQRELLSNEQEEISLEHLRNGFYLVNLSNLKGEVIYSEKIVLQ